MVGEEMNERCEKMMTERKDLREERAAMNRELDAHHWQEV